jgi:hypothetical protein
MALKDQINTVAGGAEGLVGSGRKGTPIDPENIKHLWVLEAGYKFTSEITREIVRSLQKEGRLVPLQDVFDVTWNNEENQRRTAPNSGITKKTRAGLYALTAMFDSGIFFQKTLESMEGSNRWQIIAIDDEDQMFGSTGRNDEFKGWQVANFEVMPYQFKQGTEGGTTSVYMQLGRSSEINKDVAYITTETLDFLPADIDGVNETRIDLGPLVNAATTFEAKTVLAKDNSTFVDGLTVSSFLVKKNGTTVTPTSVVGDAESKKYTFTLAAGDALATDDKIEVKLYDSANNRSVIEVGAAPDELLYQSKEATGVVTAA